jgi:hypothetical protein
MLDGCGMACIEGIVGGAEFELRKKASACFRADKSVCQSRRFCFGTPGKGAFREGDEVMAKELNGKSFDFVRKTDGFLKSMRDRRQWIKALYKNAFACVPIIISLSCTGTFSSSRYILSLPSL